MWAVVGTPKGQVSLAGSSRSTYSSRTTAPALSRCTTRTAVFAWLTGWTKTPKRCVVWLSPRSLNNCNAANFHFGKALKFPTPSPRGAVKELEIRGKLASRTIEPVRLTRRSRGIVNGAISRLPAMTERRVELNGRIRELNEKLMRFELHDVSQPPMPLRVCEFEAEMWDDVYEILGVEETVDVLGLETSPSSIVRVLNLERP